MSVWTERQVRTIHQNAQLPAAALAKLVNRTEPRHSLSSVYDKRYRLGYVVSPPPRGRTSELVSICQRIAAQHGLTVDDLKGKGRNIWPARRQAMAECYATGNFSLITLGKFFGGKDHTSVLHAVKQYRALAQQEAA